LSKNECSSSHSPETEVIGLSILSQCSTGSRDGSPLSLSPISSEDLLHSGERAERQLFSVLAEGNARLPIIAADTGADIYIPSIILSAPPPPSAPEISAASRGTGATSRLVVGLRVNTSFFPNLSGWEGLDSTGLLIPQVPVVGIISEEEPAVNANLNFYLSSIE